MRQLRFWWPAMAAMLMLCLGMGSPLVYGQATNAGTVVGTVTDQSGAAMPEATVTLTDPSTSSERTTTTNNTGQYVVQNVQPAVYTVTVTKSGFSTGQTSLTVSVGTQSTANFKLQVGSAQTTVEVEASGVDLQTLNQTIGASVEPELISSLPSIGHDVGTFTQLQPAVAPDGSVAGAVNDQSTFTLDGGNNTSDMDGNGSVYTVSFAGDPTGGQAGGGQPSGVMPVPADSVEEFKVNTAGQTADFNNSAGAQIEIVTKRGTNQIHGSAYEYYLDNNFSGNTWDNNLNGAKLPDYHYSKFGGGAGGPILPKLWGGRTYLFGLYQGWRYPNSQTFTHVVPSDDMRNGFVTLNGTRYDMSQVDPLHIGISPVVQAMWKQYMPESNLPKTSTGLLGCGSLGGSYCDGANEGSFQSTLAIPQKDNFLVGRVDHDFSDKLHWMASYRFYRLIRTTNSQVDFGGFFSGDKLGQATATASRPLHPWYFVTGLTANLTDHITNDFHYSFTRNYWSWNDNNAPPQAAGLGGALEPFGESSTVALTPFNVNTQSVRTRFWDGQDHFLRDDVTLIKGSHLFQFGGQYQHNYNFHQRSDNGGGINFTPVYQLGDSAGAGILDLSDLQGGYPLTKSSKRIAAALYGMVTDSQVAYTRSGADLALNTTPLTHAFDQSTIPYYNVYFSDTWHLKPSLTVTYGMGWTLEMPPTEKNGKQEVIVDDAGEPIKTEDYLNQRKLNAEQGIATDPKLGFALVANAANGLKYPYNPFYGSFSPRIGLAWNPSFDGDGIASKIFGHGETVIRGGYGRIYGRLNGVDLVLVPLLGVGLIQPVTCTKALATGACGPDTPNAETVFRVGPNGLTAPLPAASATLPKLIFPGYNSAGGSASEALDPGFRPNAIDSMNLTIQRQISRNGKIEVGYIGRLIHHEYQPVDLNAVPYMMVQGGQSFAQAYAQLETALGCATSVAQCGANVPQNITPQPFFEAALANTGYCTGYSSCTAAVVANEGPAGSGNLTNQAVWSLWSDLDNGGFNFGRTMQNTPIPGEAHGAGGQMAYGMAENASIGHGNYHAGFVSFSLANWHGVTMHNNFTYSKALGTGAFVQATSEYTPNDPFNLDAMYGVQGYNRKFLFNTYMVWQEPFFKGQRGIVGRVVGGWQLAPIFTSGSGAPTYCNTQTDAQGWGGGDGINGYFDNEQCVFTKKYSGGTSLHYNVAGSNGIGTETAGSGGAAVNMFKDPEAIFNSVRAPILGIDTKNPGVGPIPGPPFWNVDMSLQKNFKIWERTSLELSMIFANVFNHNVMNSGDLELASPGTWGVVTSQANTPRNMEFGARVSF